MCLVTDYSKKCDQSINTTLFIGLYAASKQSCNYMKVFKVDSCICVCMYPHVL